ncbi:hypothetical protein [Pseudoxanthomonas sp. UTMC 1351]|uniref:phosphotransferase-like protein n=1 Tax=Pseudoxanthomonas sp. UTMC 1351 TaxID=2695853 RepID=UPI0034CEE08C
MAIVVCFSGRIGSGKTSVSRAVANKINGVWTGFGDLMRSEAIARLLDPDSREVLQDLGAQLIQEHGNTWLCEQVIARAKWDGAKPLIIDGVRHVSILDELRGLLGSHQVLLVHLDLRDGVERSRDLDQISRSSAEQHSTEQDVIKSLPQRASLIVSADLPLEQVVDQIVEYLDSPLT